MTLSINARAQQRYAIMLKVTFYSLFLPNGIMLSVDTLSVVMLSVIMLNVVMLNVVILNVVMLNVVILNVIMLNVVKLNAVMLNVVKLNAIMPVSYTHLTLPTICSV